MSNRHDVTVFEPYPFRVGQKLHIASGRRYGDWEVVAVTDAKVTLKCPISKKSFEWARFCYVVDERENQVWPEPSSDSAQ